MYKYVLKCFMGHTYNKEKSIVYKKFNITGYPTFSFGLNLETLDYVQKVSQYSLTLLSSPLSPMIIFLKHKLDYSNPLLKKKLSFPVRLHF